MNTLRRCPLTLLGAILALVLQLSPALCSFFEYHPGAPLSRPWGVLTGHFCHFGLSHFAWDTLVWLVLGLWMELRHGTLRLAIIMAAAALLISVSVALLHSDLAAYRGLSGLDSALYALTLVGDGRTRHNPLLSTLGHFALLGFLAKTIYEFHTPAPLFVSTPSGFLPLPLAHLAGLLTILPLHLREFLPKGSRLNSQHQPRPTPSFHS